MDGVGKWIEVWADSPHIQGKHQVVCEIRGPHNAGNYRANATLIAAAPELLAALEYMLRADDAICNDAGTKSDQAMNRIAAIDAARAAIAKAKGIE